MLLPLVDDNPTRRTPMVTIGLIVINTLVLVYTWFLPPVEHDLFLLTHGFIPQRLNQVFDPSVEVEIDLQRLLQTPEGQQLLAETPEAGVVTVPRNVSATLTTIFTSLFLHAGIVHLVGNMWFLWLFGNNIEDRLGHFPFFLFYLAGGIVASLCHWVAVADGGAILPTVGASGAVSAVLGAYAVTYPQARVRCLLLLFIILLFVDLPAIVVLGLWIGMQVIQGFGAIQLGTDGGVAWWAHIGGFAWGAVLMPILAMLIVDRTYHAPSQHSLGLTTWDAFVAGRNRL
ncbi:MAG: rhomboid family intramembrane serine protease [Pirellulaceae bacterium]